MRYLRHGRSVEVIRGLDFAIAKGEVVGVYGSNGCGKSTLLRLLSGTAPMSEGEINWQANSPRVSLIPQDFRTALLPWYSAQRNLELPLQFRNKSAEDVSATITSMVGALGENLDLTKNPGELSGGQQQILAIMCAMVQSPALLLMDEPFSALNLQRLFDFRPALRRLWRASQTAVVVVSHNLDDLLMVADRLLIVDGPPMTVLAEEAVPENGERCEASILSTSMLDLKSRIYQIIRREGKPVVSLPLS